MAHSGLLLPECFARAFRVIALDELARTVPIVCLDRICNALCFFFGARDSHDITSAC